MQEILEKVQKVVEAYNPKVPNANIKTARALLPHVNACKQYIKDNAQTDRGCAQRLSRQLDEILAGLPDLRHFAGDKQEVSARHTRKLAEDHLEALTDYLKQVVEEEEAEKKRAMLDWVKAHPVFNELRKTASRKSLQKEAYILLFQKNDDGQLQLVTKKTKDGMVITRMRPRDFTDSFHLHKAFSHKRPIAGAAVIVNRELLSAIGELPQAEGNKSQVDVLLSISKEAASKPAQDFLERTNVLKTLHEMAKKRQIPKDAYVLLFREGVAEVPAEDVGAGQADVGAAPAPPAATEQHAHAAQADAELAQADAELAQADAELAQVDVAAAPAPPEQELTEQSSEHIESAAHDHADESISEHEAHTLEEPSLDDDAAHDSAELAEDEPSEHSQTPAQEVADQVPHYEHLDIVTRKSEDGKVITRFWTQDFVIKHKLYDEFRGKKPIVGAAIIGKGQLIQTIGAVPQPTGNQTPLQAVLKESNTAVAQPSMEFLESHEVLKSLYGLANDKDFPHKTAYVLLFMQPEGGSIELVRRERGGAKLPLHEFQSPKTIFDRYSTGIRVVGASVIDGDAEPPRDSRFPRRDDRQRREERPRSEDGPKRSDRPQQPHRKPSVVAAFGRTPLKVSLLATPENFARLGLKVEDDFRPRGPRPPHHDKRKAKRP